MWLRMPRLFGQTLIESPGGIHPIPSSPIAPPPDHEDVVCNLCGVDDTAPFVTATERRFGLGGQFQYVQCLQCGLVYLDPRPAAEVLAAHYYPDGDYYAHRRVNRTRGPRGRLRLLVKKAMLAAHRGYPLPHGRLARVIAQIAGCLPYQPARFARLPPYVIGGRVLDVGCGNGNHLYSLRELGWNVVGVEPDAQAARYARTELWLDVRPTTLEKAGLATDSVDVALMFHVLEHVPDPLRTLREVRRVLKPGGYLMVETPDVSGWPARLFRSWWFHLDAPRHLYLFTSHTLSALLHAAGFRRIDLAHLAVTSGITGSLQYLWNAHTGDPRGNRIRHNRVFAWLCRPAVWLAASRNSSDVVRAVAWRDTVEGGGSFSECP